MNVMFDADADRDRLVDEITYKLAADANDTHTQSAILGPFYRHDHPLREKGSTITFDTPKDAQVTYMHGRVTNSETGKPLEDVEIDVWQASTNGKSDDLCLWSRSLTSV